MSINEGSSCTIVLTFRDEDDVLVTPDSATYRIDDVASETSILAETPFSPTSSTHDLEITAAQNAILNQTNVIEKHEITVSFTYSGGFKIGKGSYILDVTNLKFIP